MDCAGGNQIRCQIAFIARDQEAALTRFCVLCQGQDFHQARDHFMSMRDRLGVLAEFAGVAIGEVGAANEEQQRRCQPQPDPAHRPQVDGVRRDT
jgi:hypothetical protein